MEKPTCLRLEAKRLNKELDELLWNGATTDEIKPVATRLEIVNLKLNMGETHDWSF